MERIVFLFSSWDMRFVPAIFAAVFGLLEGGIASKCHGSERGERARERASESDASERGVDEESPITTNAG